MIIVMLAAAAQVVSGVAHVVDGDTLDVGGTRLRLFGIDAPELSQRCGAGGRVRCGVVAAAWLRRHVDGARLYCRVVDRDRYSRSVAICTRAGQDVGAGLVAAGWAVAYRRYSVRYVRDEDAARAARRGIWETGFEQPARYRQGRRAAAPAQVAPDRRCLVKGNVGAGGDRIYHLPGSREYGRVRIDAGRGERWFCSAADAAAAGWRAARER